MALEHLKEKFGSENEHALVYCECFELRPTLIVMIGVANFLLNLELVGQL